MWQVGSGLEGIGARGEARERYKARQKGRRMLPDNHQVMGGRHIHTVSPFAHTYTDTMQHWSCNTCSTMEKACAVQGVVSWCPTAGPIQLITTALKTGLFTTCNMQPHVTVASA